MTTNRPLLNFISLLIFFASSLTGLADEKREPNPPLRLLAPAYFYPAGEGLKAWAALIAAAPKTPITAIVNPDSGPGRTVDKHYLSLFRLLKQSKLATVGYVRLDYAKRSIEAVKADVDRWIAFYPDVQGIFFDEQPSGKENAEFARLCFAYARSRIKGASIVANPGALCAAEYFADPASLAVCMFESDKDFDKYEAPAWSKRLSREHFAVLLYNVKTEDEMRRSFETAFAKGAGLLYITDAAGATAWNRLPSYWQAEVSLAVQANQTRHGQKSR